MDKKKDFLVLGILSVLVIGSFSFSVFAQDQPSLNIENTKNSNSAKFVPGQLIVGLEKPDSSFNDKALLHGGQVISSIDQIKAHVVQVPIDAEDKFIAAISKNTNVRYVERDFIITASSVPNDPIYPVQWGPERVGMELVWPSTFDLGSGIKIAVVDTGIYWDHPDLLGTNILTGYNFVEGNTNTKPTTICIDQNGIRAESHATFVTGIIAAATNNGEGVAGIGKFIILPVKVLNQCGSGSSSNVASGIIYAADEGANVINLSLGSSVASSAIEDAVNYAHAWPTDAVIVAASGNGGNNATSYPAAFPNVISVGATSSDDEIASYSQFGPTLELSAPGGTSEPNCAFPSTTFIVSTGVGLSGSTPIMQYSCGTGTSYAAPIVSAVAGLLKAANPSAENEEIRLHLQQTAEDLGSPNYDIYFGHGLVRADIALSTPINPVDPDTTPPVITLVGADPQTIEGATPYVELGATASDIIDGDITVSIVIDASAVDTSTPDLYSVTYDVSDSSGNLATQVTRTVDVVDTTPPVITLVGADPQTIEAETPYVELGATASDTVDGDITGSIFIDTSNVDTSTPGSYSVTYDVMDSAGNSAIQTTRTVTVEDNTPVDPDTVHVGDLNWQASNKKNWKAIVTITAHDVGESLVSDVLVQATFTTENFEDFSVNCTTGLDGTCQVDKTTKLSLLYFTVDSLSATGFESSNTHHDPGDDFPYGDPTVTIPKGSSSGDSTPAPEPDPDPESVPNCPPKSKKPVCNP